LKYNIPKIIIYLLNHIKFYISLFVVDLYNFILTAEIPDIHVNATKVHSSLMKPEIVLNNHTTWIDWWTFIRIT